MESPICLLRMLALGKAVAPGKTRGAVGKGRRRFSLWSHIPWVSEGRPLLEGLTTTANSTSSSPEFGASCFGVG
jgi:hypothetical protein